MIKILKFSLSSLLLIKPYGFPLQSWVTIDFLSSVYQDRLVRVKNANGGQGFHLRTRLDSLFNITSVFSINTVLSNEETIRVEAGPVIRGISKLFSVFFLVSLVIGLIVVVEDKSALGRFLIVTFLGFSLLTSLVNLVHFLQYLLLRSTLNRSLKKRK